jgi:dienelactone hydrolase
VALVAAAALLAPVGRGVERTVLQGGPEGSVPVTVYVPSAPIDPTSMPGVVVAHGFAGSSTLMRAWSTALARAGFVVAAPDLAGHGRNVTLAPSGDAQRFVADLEAALDVLAELPGVDSSRLALLGHSMGSGAVLRLAIDQPERFAAIVAVSPTDAQVDEERPRDLLLLAGSAEPRFVANAQSLLERAGGERGLPGDGDARRFLVIPRTEHVTILFSSAAHAASISWLSDALGHPGPEVRASVARGPMLGWAVLVLAIVLTWRALVLGAGTPAPATTRRAAAGAALLLGGVASTASLVIVARSFDVASWSGVLVAGELGLWFLMTGAVWLRFGVRPAAPDARDAGWGLLATAMVVAVGASSSSAWLTWWLPSARVPLMVALTLACLPFALAASAAIQGRRGVAALGTWLATSAAVLVTLGAAAFVVPGLGFVVLLLPLLPAVIGLLLVLGVGLDRPWAAGGAGAVLLGWLMAGMFPLA